MTDNIQRSDTQYVAAIWSKGVILKEFSDLNVCCNWIAQIAQLGVSRVGLYSRYEWSFRDWAASWFR